MMIGSTISHYKILDKLGEGGMGVVYKAEDIKLRRTVALKILPESSTSSPESLARFEQEAKAISALNHPNIATIYDVDEADGRKFLALEYISGGTLKELIRNSLANRRELPISDIVEYGIEMAAGLNHAHREGIVHRDVKSDNMMLTKDGNVKITDFGLAKLRGAVQLTRSGSTVGTAAYMSPEQVQGLEADSRSDLFSLGVVLYELATLQLPFRGEHEAALAYSIVHTEPQDIAAKRRDFPPALAGVIGKCLEKNILERYRHASEIEGDLKSIQSGGSGSVAIRVARHSNIPWLIAAGVVLALVVVTYLLKPGGSSSANAKTIAVLPFTNMSGLQEDEYFSEGMTEDILTQLSKIADLNVISRTTMMQYKGSNKTLREIGKELNAGVVLEGSVRRAGDRVRIVAQLIDAENDRHLWADTYDNDFKDIFLIQSDVAQKIAGALQASLSPQEKKRIERIPTSNIEAYNTYLKAQYLIRKTTPVDLEKGLELMHEAIKLDSNFALPYSGIAYFYMCATDFYIAPAVAMPELKKAATKALEIDVDLAKGHTVMGFYFLWYEWNWDRARNELEKGVELGPRDYFTHFVYSWYFLSRGDYESANAEAKQYIELEPIAGEEGAFYGMQLYFERKYDQAYAQLTRILDLDPSYPFTRLFTGWCYAQQGKIKQSITEQQRAHELFRSPWSLARMGYARAQAGQQREARAILDTLERESKNSYVPSDIVASIYVALHDYDRAFVYLEKGYEERAGWMLWLKIDPIWDPIRPDPRFVALLKKMHLD